jgi:hypothetical protein
VRIVPPRLRLQKDIIPVRDVQQEGKPGQFTCRSVVGILRAVSGGFQLGSNDDAGHSSSAPAPQAILKQLDSTEHVIWWSAGRGLDLRVKAWGLHVVMLGIALWVCVSGFAATVRQGSAIQVFSFMTLWFCFVGYHLVWYVRSPAASLYALTNKRVIVRIGRFPPQWSSMGRLDGPRSLRIGRIDLWKRFGNHGLTLYLPNRTRRPGPLDLVGIDNPDEVAQLISSTLAVKEVTDDRGR